MTALTLEATQPAPDSPEAEFYLYKVTARPAHAREFTFYVAEITTPRGFAYLVKGTPDGPNWFSRHRSPEKAVGSANYRARRYVRAYSKPRNVLPTRQPAAA